jgi:hypothetical protein
MTKQTNWRILASGASDRALLAVDFGPGRREAGFAELVVNLAPDTLVWQPVFLPQTDDPVHGTDSDLCVREWLDDLHAAGLEISGVLGYCAGATLAARLADLIRASGPRDPAVVLLDPSRVDGAVIQKHFVSSAEAYAELLAPELVQDAVAAAAHINGSLGTDLAERSAASLADAMRDLQRLYDGIVRSVCEAIDADDEVGTSFSTRFAAFLSYLVTAARAGTYPAERGNTTVVVSEDHRLHDGFGVAHHRVPVSRAALLADPSVARIVAQAVA